MLQEDFKQTTTKVISYFETSAKIKSEINDILSSTEIKRALSKKENDVRSGLGNKEITNAIIFTLAMTVVLRFLFEKTIGCFESLWQK